MKRSKSKGQGRYVRQWSCYKCGHSWQTVNRQRAPRQCPICRSTTINNT